MGAHALQVLELGRVLERVAARASSELGRRRVLELRPSADAETVARELARVAAALRFRDEHPEWGLGELQDAGPALEKLRARGAVLEPAELLRVGALLAASRELREALGTPEGAWPELDDLRERSLALPELEREIERCVDPDGTVRSTASRELKRIRGRLRGAHGRIVRTLESYLASLPERWVVPDASVTLREGRYVVPVRREGKGEVGGIVHGESQTGATLYVEPPVAIEMMNEVRDLEGEEAREVARILRELSERIAPHAEALEGALDALAEMDSLDARARTARAWNAAVPEVVPAEAGDGDPVGGGALRVREGRHPLLVEARDVPVVPFDLDLEPGERALVVSGPNTGGKSVFLKAVGLVSALAQSGIVPPVGAGTRLPVYRKLFADIGDEQSIARNLSTFSAHLANLAEIVTAADAGSLVLIDEMGTGTDPADGAALARAILEELVARGATTVVTSHLGELKRLDREGSGVVNASLQFDSERMEPTYRLVKGRPGRSYGLAIARRLGFPGRVLDRAEAYRDEGGAQLDEVLARLEQEERRVRELAAELDVERARTTSLRADLEARERALADAERTAEARAREEARRLLLEARSEVEEAIRELRGAAAGGGEVDEAAREARRRVERAARELRVAAPRPRGRPDRRPEPGDAVVIRATGARGRVTEVRDERALVEAGALRLELPVADLEVVEAAPQPAPERGRGGGWRGPSLDRVHAEVDLRGMRVEEIERELTRALDEAVLGDLGELRIIHGKGTGALRKRVAELLAADARVLEHRLGGPGEGGAGVTVARLA